MIGKQKLCRTFLLCTLLALSITGPYSSSIYAQTFNSGSTGADGPFSPTTNTTLQLPPNGTFNFTTVNIPAGITVTFAWNITNTPVTILATGDVTIAGKIDLNGRPGGDARTGTALYSLAGLGGPGGFDGGTGGDGVISTRGASGLGPGGGGGGEVGTIPLGYGVQTLGLGGGGGGFGSAGTSAAYPDKGGGSGGPSYGTPNLLPLVRGSGGGGSGARFGYTGAGGGGGGGAILVASSGTITLTGSITANGGNGGYGLANQSSPGGGGSGGAVRLIANSIKGSGGSISVAGGSGSGTDYGKGGSGRIRIEAYTMTATISFSHAPSIGKPGSVVIASEPTIRIASVAGITAPSSPSGSYSNPDITLPADTTNPVSVVITASNVPLGTPVNLTITPYTGSPVTVTGTALTGTLENSTATATVNIPANQPCVISASATFTLTASGNGQPMFIGGERVKMVRVASVFGGKSNVTYITESGREINQ